MSDVLIHFEDAVLTHTLNRGHKKNAFTQEMYVGLAQSLRDAQDRPEVRVVIIQAHETIFSAGNDVADFLSAEGFGLDSPVIDFLQTLASFQKPVIASVCGPAVGIGSSMLLHCDLVVAGDNAAFSLPFVNLGLCPRGGVILVVAAVDGLPPGCRSFVAGRALHGRGGVGGGLGQQGRGALRGQQGCQGLGLEVGCQALGGVDSNQGFDEVAPSVDGQGGH